MTSWSRSELDALMPPRAGRGVCRICFNLIDPHQEVCRACARSESHLEFVLPVSYALGGDGLHARLVAYKRDADPFVSEAVRSLAEMLDHAVTEHEICLGRGRRFDVVTCVPSSAAARDRLHPLRRIVADLVGATSGRHQRLLSPWNEPDRKHEFSRRRFIARARLSGERILLLDDTWATGASAQSAAAALLDAGASTVSALVLARYLNPWFRGNIARARELRGSFSWSRCAICATTSSSPAKGESLLAPESARAGSDTFESLQG